jgi:hypothetical protein
MQENGRKLASKVSSRVEELLGIVYPIIQAPFRRICLSAPRGHSFQSRGPRFARSCLTERVSHTRCCRRDAQSYKQAIRGESVGVNLRCGVEQT